MTDNRRRSDQPFDPVKRPSHYNKHPSGVETIDITEHLTFNLGNAVKYAWRAGLKDSATSTQDLEKALWYLEREIARLQGKSLFTRLRENLGKVLATSTFVGKVLGYLSLDNNDSPIESVQRAAELVRLALSTHPTPDRSRDSDHDCG